ncbi:HD domain-containing protein [Spirillospora sp. CA-108201]
MHRAGAGPAIARAGRQPPDGDAMTATLESLLAQLPTNLPATDRDRIRRAYEFAARRHAGQHRKSGDPYITPPLAVAQMAAGSGLDDVVICAALYTTSSRTPDATPSGSASGSATRSPPWSRAWSRSIATRRASPPPTTACSH